MASTTYVALLTEGVDRNNAGNAGFGLDVVALLTEGVDRNVINLCIRTCWQRSPSSRRAWIEIRHTLTS